jgi:hypothetical protein
VGGVVVLGLALFGLFFIRRRKQANERKKATLSQSYAVPDMSEHMDGGKLELECNVQDVY